MRLLTFLLFILLGATVKADWKPTDGRLYNWAARINVGISNGITSTRTQWCDATVSIPGTNIVFATTNADNTSAFNAIRLLAPTNSYAYVPAGTYTFTNTAGVSTSSGFTDPSSSEWTIRGAGSNTVFYINPPGGTMQQLLSIGSSLWGSSDGSGNGWKNGTNGCYLTNDLAAGATSITVSNLPRNSLALAAGVPIGFDQTNDDVTVTAWRSGGTDKTTSYDRPQDGTRNDAFYAIVTSISGNTINFWPPAPRPMTTARAAWCGGSQFARSGTKWYGMRIGIENIRFSCNTNRTINRFIYLNSTDCWIKDCYFENMISTAVYMANAVRPEIRDSWFKDAAGATVGVGYGIQWRGCAWGLIENNLFTQCYIPMIGSSSAGMVIGYNYLTNTITQARAGVAGIDLNFTHGSHSTHDLIEGNIASRAGADFDHGSSGKNTLYRNHLRGIDLDNTNNIVCVQFDGISFSNTVACNVLGTTNLVGSWNYQPTNSGYANTTPQIYKLGYPYIGSTVYFSNPWTNYLPAVTTSLWKHGNYHYASNAIEYVSGDTNRYFEPSLYYTNGAPSWWDTNAWPWPPIGPDRSQMVGYIPAQGRYEGRTNSPYLSASASTSTEDPDEFIRRVFFFLPTIFLRNYFDIRWNP